MPDAELLEPRSQATARVQRLGAVIVVLLVTIVVLLFRDRLTAYARYGYLGVFLTTLLGSATVVLPVPGLAIIYLGGSIWNPILVGLVAGVADAAGEATGYLAGYAGHAIVENASLYVRFEKWMRHHGFLTILALSAIPNPFFDLAGVAAGASGFPARWFFLAAWIGKTIKDLIFAVAGYYSISLFTHFFATGFAPVQ